jgi:hypothetical protein
MSASATLSNTSIFDRIVKTMPPIVIAASATFAAYGAAPLLSAFLHPDVAPIAAPVSPVVQSAAPEPVAAPASEIKAAPRVHLTSHRIRHHVVKHHHHHLRKVQQACSVGSFRG